MNKKELEKLLKTNTPQELINKYIKNEIILNESQISKLIKLKGEKNVNRNKEQKK